jgi:hypothetical protein
VITKSGAAVITKSGAAVITKSGTNEDQPRLGTGCDHQSGNQVMITNMQVTAQAQSDH